MNPGRATKSRRGLYTLIGTSLPRPSQQDLSKSKLGRGKAQDNIKSLERNSCFEVSATMNCLIKT